MLTLTSQFGIRVILQMGAHVPLPPPADVLTALTEVEVSSGHEEQHRHGCGYPLVRLH